MAEDPALKKPDSTHEESTEVGSLSDYIAKHLQNRSAQVWQTEPEAPEETRATFPAPPPVGEANQVGFILHHMDSQLINDHLEKYLPTAATRFHMMRERIGRELREINEELAQYQKLGGQETATRIQVLTQRKAMLDYKLTLLDERLNDINPFRGVYQKFFQGSSSENSSAGPWRFFPAPKTALSQAVSQVNGELESLTHILEDQLHDPNFSPNQLGRLVNQYDAQLKQAEALLRELEAQQGLGQMLQSKLRRWFQAWTQGSL